MREPNPEGVPLSHYRSHAGCRVRFSCAACGRSFDVELETVIARLEHARLGGPQTGIKDVGRRSRRPCRCGAVAWDTRPAFAPDPERMGGPGYAGKGSSS